MLHPICPVCGSGECMAASAAFGVGLHNGEQYYCMCCGHGFRNEVAEYAYAEVAMCGAGSPTERLKSQVTYFAPYLPANPAILEIGCATGGLAAVARPMLDPVRYDGVELSRETGEKAKPHLDTLFDQPLQDLIAAKKISGPYDLVIISHVLEHIPDPRQKVLQMKSLLSPEGVLFIEVPHGAGHELFPADDNPAHIHFFSPDSLMRLISLAGMHTAAVATGIYMDPRYANSIRLVARARPKHVWRGPFISDFPALKDVSDIVVWAAPSLVEDVLANYFDISKIAFFIDSHPGKQGISRLGKEVRGPEALGHTPRTVFINSLYWEGDIRAMIARMYPNVEHRIICMREVLEADTQGPRGPQGAGT